MLKVITKDEGVLITKTHQPNQWTESCIGSIIHKYVKKIKRSVEWDGPQKFILASNGEESILPLIRFCKKCKLIWTLQSNRELRPKKLDIRLISD